MCYPYPNFSGTRFFGFYLNWVHIWVLFLKARIIKSPNYPTRKFGLTRMPSVNGYTQETERRGKEETKTKSGEPIYLRALTSLRSVLWPRVGTASSASSQEAFLLNTFGSVSSFVLFRSTAMPTLVRVYLFTHCTTEILLNPVFEDLRTPKVPNNGRFGRINRINNTSSSHFFPRSSSSLAFRSLNSSLLFDSTSIRGV
jgi:hypothetical protein